MARERRDYVSTLVGLAVFLGGVALILWAFQMAWQLFNVPPNQALEIGAEKEINLNRTLSAAAGLIVRILLLVVMAGFGSMIANRGIRLYAASQKLREDDEPIKPVEPPTEEA